MSVLKTIVGVVVGVVAAGLPIAGVEAVAHGRLQGDALFIAVIIGYGIGAFLGTAVAAKIAGARMAMAVPLLLGLLATLNLFAFPHPWWFAPLGIVALAIGWRSGIALPNRFSKGNV